MDKYDTKGFMGILVLSGCLAPRRRRLLWENASETLHDLVATAMRRDKFKAISANFQ